jgi:hypothetical protein
VFTLLHLIHIKKLIAQLFANPNLDQMPSNIIWPQKYLPGTTNNYASNEVIMKGVTAGQVWPYLADITKYKSYYSNIGQITPPSSCPMVEKDDKL